MIKCLLTELGRAGRENIWPSLMALGPYAMALGQIFSLRPSYSVNKYILFFSQCLSGRNSTNPAI